MNKNVLLVLLALFVVVGCAPSQEPEETASAPQSTEAISTEDFEEGEVEEAEEEEELETPPEGALPLSQILAMLEAGGYLVIIEVEFEDGVWEVEHVVDGEEQEIEVDPMTGEILPDEDDDSETEDEAEPEPAGAAHGE